MEKIQILIVDDEPINLGALRKILGKEYKLYFAKSGLEALDMVEKHNPSLILLDIHMPGMNGYEVCQALKQNPDTENIPVIFVTSSSEEFKGLQYGAVDYITKPISSEDVVLARVRNHLSLVNEKTLQNSHRAAIHMLGEAGHFNDEDTGVHIWRMSAFCKAMAIRLGWDEKDAEQLKLAAAMHDTGKIGVPSNILRAERKLTDEEWVTMRKHTVYGYEILSQSDAPLFKWAADIALYHHEKWDGSGYPHKLKGEDIPIIARIVAICDVYDALRAKRPYKIPFSEEKTFAILREGRGTHFDPVLLDLFFDIHDEIRDLKEYWDNKEANTNIEVNQTVAKYG